MNTVTPTLMETEARETPQRLIEQAARNAATLSSLCSRLRNQAPVACMMIGRGTSDHAGVFGKYLIEIELGVPVFPAAPSIATVYDKQLRLHNMLAIAISQSGKSPDIIRQAEYAKEGGALVLAMVNDEHSPLAQIADVVLPLMAGTEQAVAATKSYLCSLSLLLQLVAQWKQDAALIEALEKLPRHLMAACNTSTQLRPEMLQNTEHLICLGRGLGYAIGKEMALKLKEVCSLHAEAFSSAEFLHGPIALANRPLSVLDIGIQDEAWQAHKVQVEHLRSRNIEPIALSCPVRDVHPRLQPLLLMQRFYLDVAAVAVARGFNPDAPTGLKKVTATL